MTETEIRAAYHAHQDAIYRFAWRMTGSENSAADVVHDCFVALLRTPEAYDSSRAPIRGFLFAIARNQLRKRWRTESRWEALDDNDSAAEPVDPASGETAALVGQAVQSLPPLQREALVLFEYEELSLEEIARAVGAETGAVKARLHRARENLRRMLAPLRPAGYGSTRWNP